MRFLVLGALILSLASCTAATMNSPKESPKPSPVSTNESVASGAMTGTQAIDVVSKTGSIMSLNYTLRTDSPTGKVEETTIQSVAEANGLFKTGATFQPFQVVLGQGQVIPGFEAGLVGLKKGDKKIIKVIPSEGYGRPVTIPKEQIAPKFSLTRDKKMFDNTIRQTVDKTQFPTEMKAQVDAAKVGSMLDGGNGMKLKVVELTGTQVTFEIENTRNPFYKKVLKVGATATTATADFKITAMSGATVTLEITNKESPFYGKSFAVGESATPPNGPKITLKNITDKEVTILADHKFMNKDLYFDVEVVDVK